MLSTYDCARPEDTLKLLRIIEIGKKLHTHAAAPLVAFKLHKQNL